MLKDVDCDFFQGDYFLKLGTLEKIKKFLKKNI